ncbi:MAG TPA: patatin-like phospholipase family protein [bacterium]|nr:patatin-like phospholipase family protein [bacterium]
MNTDFSFALLCKIKSIGVALLLIGILWVSGCAPTVPAAPPVPPKSADPKIALVLGGGAARGFAHVGVLRVLEQEKIPLSRIVGTSVGSLVGALYAGNPNTFELEWAAFQLERDDVLDFSIFSARTGPVTGNNLERFVDRMVRVKQIESLKIPYAAVATDLETGKPVVMDRGPVAKAVHASSAIPGVFTPVEYGGKLLVDGGVSNNVPVDVARQLGADLVIAVNVGQGVQTSRQNLTNVVDIILQAVNIMGNLIVQTKLRDADVTIEPRVGQIGAWDFSQKKQAMGAGIEAAQRAIPEIRAKIQAWKGIGEKPKP